MLSTSLLIRKSVFFDTDPAVRPPKVSIFALISSRFAKCVTFPVTTNVLPLIADRTFPEGFYVTSSSMSSSVSICMFWHSHSLRLLSMTLPNPSMTVKSTP